MRGQIEDILKSNAQLNALLAWERDVVSAAGATLSTILGLIPPGVRTVEDGASALDDILSILAREQVGKDHVGTDVRSAITSILSPILADRIINRTPAEGTPEIWNEAVTRHEDRGLEMPDAA